MTFTCVIRDLAKEQPEEEDLFDQTAEHYAQIRARQGVSAADAMHLACAAPSSVDLFLTKDRRLRGLVIGGIHFIVGTDTGIF